MLSICCGAHVARSAHATQRERERERAYHLLACCDGRRRLGELVGIVVVLLDVVLAEEVVDRHVDVVGVLLGVEQQQRCERRQVSRQTTEAVPLLDLRVGRERRGLGEDRHVADGVARTASRQVRKVREMVVGAQGRLRLALVVQRHVVLEAGGRRVLARRIDGGGAAAHRVLEVLDASSRHADAMQDAIDAIALGLDASRDR